MFEISYTTAIAEEDSADGKVMVRLAGVPSCIPTTFSCLAGDTLQVRLFNHKPMVIGIVGRGDEVRTSMNTLQENTEELDSTLTGVSSDVDYIAVWSDIPIWEDDNSNEEHRPAVEIAKRHYENGDWSIGRIDALLEAGKITQEEYIYIVGENKGKKAMKN